MQDLRSRIAHDGITAEATVRSQPPDYINQSEWPQGATWYDVTLRWDGRELRTPFGQGPAITHAPDAAEVINALCSDASGYDNTDGFDDWCSDYGIDADSRKNANLYRRVGDQAENIHALQGHTNHAYLEDTERL